MHLHISGNAIFHTIKKREGKRVNFLLDYSTNDRFGESRTKLRTCEDLYCFQKVKAKTCCDSVCQYYIYYSRIFYVDRKVISEIYIYEIKFILLMLLSF